MYFTFELVTDERKHGVGEATNGLPHSRVRNLEIPHPTDPVDVTEEERVRRTTKTKGCGEGWVL